MWYAIRWYHIGGFRADAEEELEMDYRHIGQSLKKFRRALYQAA
jgi:hypothetical protein